jgi:hypothetical protein
VHVLVDPDNGDRVAVWQYRNNHRHHAIKLHVDVIADRGMGDRHRLWNRLRLGQLFRASQYGKYLTFGGHHYRRSVGHRKPGGGHDDATDSPV